MKKFKISFFLFILVVILSQCKEEVKKTDAECLINDPNPNKSSELAILMRAMATHAESVKGQVIQGKLTGVFPEEFRKIHTATPTDSMIKGDSFDSFANGYIKNLELLYANTGSLNTSYNAVINTCISCHEQSCPGPLVRINKMKI